MAVSINGWFIRENPIKWMIWEYPHFRKPPYEWRLIGSTAPRHAKMYKVNRRMKKVDSMAFPEVSNP